IQQLHHPKAIEKIHEEQTVNLYDFEASAGLRTLFDNGRANVIDTIRIPNLPKCDGAIHIVGDSMYPILKSGDIVLYKEINLDVRNIYWGETYLLSYYEDEEDVAVVIKYVQRSEEPGCIKLVSHNAHHAPRDIEFSKINAMAIVKASIRINSMY
ncbi:MAG: S24 family peptidase, partial [Porphyromonadaceae bacterium]|nr:S24 family peptidase [Porphyromonadaceae bacterium]